MVAKKRGRPRKKKQLDIGDLDREPQSGDNGSLFDNPEGDEEAIHDEYVAEEVKRELRIPFR